MHSPYQRLTDYDFFPPSPACRTIFPANFYVLNILGSKYLTQLYEVWASEF